MPEGWDWRECQAVQTAAPAGSAHPRGRGPAL